MLLNYSMYFQWTFNGFSMLFNRIVFGFSTLYPCIVVKVMTTVAEPLLIGCMNRQPPLGELPKALQRSEEDRSGSQILNLTQLRSFILLFNLTQRKDVNEK